MKWTVVGVLVTLQLISLVCGVQDSQQTIHDHLQSENLIPVQSQAAQSHLVYEGSGDITDQSEKIPIYKVTRPPPSIKPPRDIKNIANGHHNASVVILHKPSPAIIVLIVILILLLLTSLLVIGYLWRRVRILKERHKKPYPTEGEFDEDEYSVMMDWNAT
ncbi:uncharacterized protein LOC133177118 isoform X2 [Saccostrea echinata]|uniref:uncharacterized protein LOC133177118 isoform X2 n=1 Tax=Saccostrea echinata TaxID=191078 RepID=UPI002A8410E7|nr:uncharacterized protein LOC133177118 isoform X2 [Saccostrea echinata]